MLPTDDTRRHWRELRPSKILTVSLASIAWLSAPVCAADEAEAFYKGRTIDLFVGTPASGGYNLYARLVAEALGNFIPGQPRIVVRNMPGAAHLTMTNHVYNSAPKDGSVIAIPQQAVAVEQTLGATGVHYDARQFNWIGRATPVVTITFTWHTSPTKTIADARIRVTVMGATGASSPTTLYTTLLTEVAGAKFKIVSGYAGSQETQLAIERGEVEGGIADWTSFRVTNADWIKEKKVNIMVQWAVNRSPDLPDVPLAVELATSDADRRVLEFFATGNELGRAFFTTPGAPPERVKALREAFAKMMADPKFQATAAAQKLAIGPAFGGEELAALVDKTLSLPPNLVTRARSLIGR
jgi:tripartite-type tricarboxylate transporter receptor subunit TctC